MAKLFVETAAAAALALVTPALAATRADTAAPEPPREVQTITASAHLIYRPDAAAPPLIGDISVVEDPPAAGSTASGKPWPQPIRYVIHQRYRRADGPELGIDTMVIGQPEVSPGSDARHDSGPSLG